MKTERAVFHPIENKQFRLNDVVGGLVKGITDNWLLNIRETNPAILDMFKDADMAPQRHMLPWSGEFAGKHLTAAAQIYSMTRDERLKESLTAFVAEMLSYQKPNGYMGPWPKEFELTGRAPVMGYCFDKEFIPHDSQTWDTWAHYHIMNGLIRWYEVSGQKNALEGALRIADCFLAKFFGKDGYRMWDNGDQDMNLAPYHIFVVLYRLTGEQKYLDFAREVEKDLEKPPAGDYIRCALADQEFYQMPKPRWESLHAVEGIAEMYWATGDENYKKAFEHIWWSILKTDVHNTGGFSSREQAVGNPYNNWQIETCCVIAYMATTVDMLRISGDSRVADAMEWQTYNAALGAFNPSGRWSTYNTPMEGYKRANYHDIGFQCRPGSPDLNCCSVNAPRAFGMLSDWAFMTDNDGGLVINYYGESVSTLIMQRGETYTVVQNTGYPYEPEIRIYIDGLVGKKKVSLRIPFWSQVNSLTVAGETMADVNPGYYVLDREWAIGDEIVLTLDFSLRYWQGEDDYFEKSSIFRGPMLLCFDPHYDEANAWEQLPAMDAKTLKITGWQPAPRGGALFSAVTGEGKPVTFCDLFAAGTGGAPYTTWFEVDGVVRLGFKRVNPQHAYIPR